MRQPQIDWRELKIDSLLITGPENVRYLTGFTGSNAVLLLLRDAEPVFFTDPRYEIQSKQEVGGTPVIVRQGALATAVAALIRRKRLRRVGFERAHLSYEQFAYYEASLPAARLLPVGPLIELQRMIKSEEELTLIRRSVLTNSAAFERTVKKIRPGIRESDVAAEIDYQLLTTDQPLELALLAYLSTRGRTF